MKPKTTLGDIAANFAWALVIALVMALLTDIFVKAWDYEYTHPYTTPTLHHSQENR